MLLKCEYSWNSIRSNQIRNPVQCDDEHIDLVEDIFVDLNENDEDQSMLILRCAIDCELVC